MSFAFANFIQSAFDITVSRVQLHIYFLIVFLDMTSLSPTIVYDLLSTSGTSKSTLDLFYFIYLFMDSYKVDLK